ncbi:IS110 family transposase [Halopseudomonas sp.]|uniref:IS110 family transposase n=1 Tax=Halopseudomonas sp. TaxID=2901191 RepID=UPI003001A7A0
MNKFMTIGIDLAKAVFFISVLDGSGKQVRRKKLRRHEVLAFLANYPEAVVGMEACSGAHYWARQIQALGHEVHLLPAQHVKAYLRGQKNDYNDAQAIAEAVQHGRIRCVEVKTSEQQLDQSLHRLRQSVVVEQTGLVNRTRALLAEHGVCLPEGKHRFRQAVAGMLEDAENGLPWRLRELLGRQYQLFLALEQELAWYEREIKTQAATNEHCQRLMTVPGYGPIVSSAFCGWIGNGQQFRCGRDVAAALGLVPKQYSTGGKTILGGISKRGDKHLRALLVHGARAVARYAKERDDKLSRWVQNLIDRRGYNKAVVALANKLARIGWAVVARSEQYRAMPA